MNKRKGEVRVFVDGLFLKAIDALIDFGYGTSRSEVIRNIIHDWVIERVGFEGLMILKEKGRLSLSPSHPSSLQKRHARRGGKTPLV